MSYQKIYWEDTPSDKTPITASRLNHMDDAIEANDFFVTKYSIPYELFTGDFASGTANLNDSVANYEMVEVYANETFTKLYNPSNTNFTLSTLATASDTKGFAVYVSGGKFNVNGRTLSMISNFQYAIGRDAPNPGTWTTPTMVFSIGNQIHIRKIIGFGKKN